MTRLFNVNANGGLLARAQRAFVANAARAAVIPLCTTVLLSLALVPKRAEAIWWVTEGTQFANFVQITAAKLIQAEEKTANIQHRLAQLESMRQALVKISDLQNSFRLQGRYDMAPVAESEGVEDRCTSAGGSLIGNLVRSAFSTSQDLAVQQANICREIVIAENRKHNELVKVFSGNPAKTAELLSLLKKMSADKDPGTATAAQGQSNLLINRTLDELMYSQAKVKAYDLFIAGLMDQQAAIARQALKGRNNGPVGALVSTAVLAGALEIQK